MIRPKLAKQLFVFEGEILFSHVANRRAGGNRPVFWAPAPGNGVEMPFGAFGADLCHFPYTTPRLTVNEG